MIKEFKTRLDGEWWLRGKSKDAVRVHDMDTDHIMNCIKMVVQAPSTIIAMLLTDLKASEKDEMRWVTSSWERMALIERARQSVECLTSMRSNELVDHFIYSTLGKTMRVELHQRGVNVENFIRVCKEEGGRK